MPGMITQAEARQVRLVGLDVDGVLTDGGIYLHAGPEIGVASTKAFTCQCVTLTMLALYLARRKYMSQAQSQELIDGLCATPEKIEAVLKQNDVIRDIEHKLRILFDQDNRQTALLQFPDCCHDLRNDLRRQPF